ncbi:hypothetical protein [Streptomyces venezuelae]
MPWVRLDDRFPSHRKVALLSDRAFRLYVSGLCWCSENLTEGRILDRELAVVSRVRGLKAAAKELEEAQLWDRVSDGWQIHDYLEYNPDRAKIKAERQANAARQQSFRDRKKAEREAKKKAEEERRNAQRNGVTKSAEGDGKDTTATGTRHDDDTTTRESHAENRRSSQVSGERNAVSNGTPVPLPSVVPPTEELQQQKASYEEPARIGDRPRIPEASRPLVDKLTAQGMVVGWDLQANEWILIEALILRCGIDALVVSAVGSWQGARRQPRSGRYFIPAWRDVPDATAPEAPNEHSLPVAVGQVLPINGPHRPATSDQRVQQALEAGRRLQAAADAQNQETS